jgi:drug/metabolite transporter (DMT)-like permease
MLVDATSHVWLERFRKLSPKYLAGCGFLFLLYTAVVYHAVGLARNRDQVLEVALVNYLWPAATILLSLLLLRRRASLLIWPGTALALMGVFMVMTQGSNVSWRSFQSNLESNPLPYILGLIAAVSWGLYSNLARRWSTPDSPGGVEFFVPATGFLLLLICLANPEARAWSARAVTEALALGAVTSLGYALWDFAMRRGNLSFVAAASYFTPVLSTVVSSLYLHVTPGPRLWIGCAFVVAGSLLSWRSVSEQAEDQD